MAIIEFGLTIEKVYSYSEDTALFINNGQIGNTMPIVGKSVGGELIVGNAPDAYARGANVFYRNGISQAFEDALCSSCLLLDSCRKNWLGTGGNAQRVVFEANSEVCITETDAKCLNTSSFTTTVSA